MSERPEAEAESSGDVLADPLLATAQQRDA